MSQVVLSRTRTSWDVVLGALVALAGLVILGNAVVATEVSVLFLGWSLLLVGVIQLLSAVANLGRGGFWSPAIAGAFSLAVGLMFLRHTEAAALTLTLIAGALFLTTGIARLIAAAGETQHRLPLLLSGAGATVLGLLVLLKVFDESYAVLGALLGIQTLVEGIAIMLIGTVKPTVTRRDETTLVDD